MMHNVPREIALITKKIREAGFEVYLVGGCVRDLLLKKKPKDWDITTNAKPDDIQSLFSETFYTNDFGTVGIVNETDDDTLKIVEVTPYRTESSYGDKRRPDSVTFGDSLEEDLARRDFTINAIAFEDSKGQIVDPYKGQDAVLEKVIATVGDPEERFEEDALRLMRAIRFVAELDFAIDTNTATAIQKKASNLKHISKERIRDEFIRIIMSDRPLIGLALAERLGLLEYIIPDLARAVGVDQNQAHSFDVFEHVLRAVQHSADKKWDLDIRLSALFHDIGKTDSRRWSDEKKDWTFHGHEVVSMRIVKKTLSDLKFSRETINRVTKLVRWHMFFSDPDKITLSAVRRMISNVGEENIWDLLNLRICDRVGTGRPKEQPFRFRKYKAMVEQALRDPISVSMLKTDGRHLMERFHVEPGPRIGWTLHALLEEVLEDPKKNTEEYLDKRSEELLELSDEELSVLGKSGKQKQEDFEQVEVGKIMQKHHVR
ncbi:CCA tRNA nucleotidyltransferase [hydrothermal vent metagenome]|uniref:CCA tRNA nucleotidyltransferase n=1 Tax=hydrothermal vent metagenome TaxID=652676 RepID=A0A3B0UMY7_9ZZZZ